MPRCGRCSLWWCSYSRRAWSRCARLKIKVRSSSSWRQALDPPFHDRVHAGYPDPAEHDADSSVGEHLVEQSRVLAVPVTDQVFHLAARVFEVHGQVPGCLCHPGRGRVRGDAEDPDPAGGVLDDRQDVHRGAGQRGRFEEVRGDDGVGLGTQERRPRAAGALRCRIDTGLLQDLPDGGRGDLHTQHEQFAVNTAVSPGGVLRGQAQDQPADRPDGSWPSGLVGAGTSGVPVGDQIPVPAQHSLRPDQ